MYAYVLFSVANKDYLPEIEDFPRIAARILPDTFNSTPLRYSFGERFRLLAWYPKEDVHGVRERINPGLIKHPHKGSFFTSGYSGEGMLGEEAGIFSLVNLDNGGFGLVDAPGGVGANVWISPNEDEAICWSTQPPAIATYASKTRSGFCVVGNRPRLVHAASTLGHAHRMDSDYAGKYLASGFAMDGLTPYTRTVAIGPNSSVSVRSGNYTSISYPIAPPERIHPSTPLEIKGERLAEILQKAIWPAKCIGSSNLFLSGGKDSRALACALKSIGAKIDAFTIGSPDHGEGLVAKQVADRIGGSYRMFDQKIISDPSKAAALSNSVTDGLGINFAHQYNFLYDLTHTEWLPSLHGHGHLLRGGFARTMAKAPDVLDRSLKDAFISPFVNADARSIIEPTIDAWRRRRSPDFAETRDVLFYANMDYRLGLFTSPSAMELTSKTFMVYPLLDERIARFAASLCAFDRVSERVVFSAMRKLSPDLADMPLFGEIWRFDRDPDRTDFVDSKHNFQEGFHARQPLQTTKMGDDAIASAFTYDADRVIRFNTAKVMGSSILDSSLSSEFDRLLVPEMMEEIRAIASTGRNSDALNRKDATSRFVFRQFISRVYIAATLYDLHW